ncbi:GNAT family N-acetyltransferase [Pannus brasiliensis]
MSLELIPPHPDRIPELARICHDAFAALHDRHAVERGIPDVETAMGILSMVATRPDYTGVMATLEGRAIGSNFLLHSDFVAGVGPITVDPKVQSRGIGRALMRWVVEEAKKREIRQIRLFQEALNTTSLSLYTSVGFAWRDSAASLEITPAIDDDPSIRPLTGEDIGAIEDLSSRTYGFSRSNDAKQLLVAGIPGFAREKNGRIVGYLISSLFGHASAETNEDLLALIAHSGRHVPRELAVCICPLSNPHLYRSALAAGHRTTRVLSYMSYGEFTAPSGAYLPSIQC